MRTLSLFLSVVAVATGQNCYRGFRRWHNRDLAGRVTPLRTQTVLNLQRCMDLCRATSPLCRSFVYKKTSSKCAVRRSEFSNETEEASGKEVPELVEQTNWGQWSDCTSSCGSGGLQIRERVCASCGEVNRLVKDVRPCNIVRCGNESEPRTPGRWAAWEDWSECGDGNPCEGTRRRQRLCHKGALYCEQDGRRFRETEQKECRCQRHDFRSSAFWTGWGRWAECSVTCGAAGEQVRMRQCTVPGACEGMVEESRACNDGACPTLSEQWSPWTDWGPCDKTCGEGVRRRERRCLVGPCTQSDNEVIACSMQNCPIPVTGAPGVQGWEPWGPWGGCSRTCGQGVRTRARRCPANVFCPGSAEQQESCFELSCPPPAGWSDWGRWSDCSATCDAGIRMRLRTCPPGSQCSGSDIDRQNCNDRPCGGQTVTWTEWGFWVACSATCGRGSRERRRDCPIPGLCPGDQFMTEECLVQPCVGPLGWNQWTTWAECSVSCGRGTRRRFRSCPTGGSCPGQSLDESECIEIDCPPDITPPPATEGWSTWSDWSPCSESCGGGFRERIRSCPDTELCPGDDIETQECNTNVCGIIGWENWEPWSSCSRTCGEGLRGRTRRCPVGGQCPGDDFQSVSCNERDCATTRPPLVGCQEWTPWSTCSVTCGPGGIQNRIRVCGAEYRPEVENRPCTPGDCAGAVWLQWEQWSTCSATCGGGQQFRSRQCSQPGRCQGSDNDNRVCGVTTCPRVGIPVWLAWQSWSDCGVTCGAARRFRTRSCSEPGSPQCVGQEVQDEFCPLPPCEIDIWGAWAAWSQCSVSCGTGDRSRRRICSGPPGSPGCPGNAEELQICFEPPCLTAGWAEWREWSGCSVTCGDLGQRTRTRSCNLSGLCPGEGRESETCDAGPCAGWSDWSAWSFCSNSCGDGVRGRTRSCPVPGACPGVDEERQACQDRPCENINWLQWQSWTQCSTSCGFGERTRRRFCSVASRCGGREAESEPCDLGPCIFLDWSGWSPWSICSASCQSGMQMRARACPKSGRCPGPMEEMNLCNNQDCPFREDLTSFVTVTPLPPLAVDPGDGGHIYFVSVSPASAAMPPGERLSPGPPGGNPGTTSSSRSVGAQSQEPGTLAPLPVDTGYGPQLDPVPSTRRQETTESTIVSASVDLDNTEKPRQPSDSFFELIRELRSAEVFVEVRGGMEVDYDDPYQTTHSHLYGKDKNLYASKDLDNDLFNRRS